MRRKRLWVDSIIWGLNSLKNEVAVSRDREILRGCSGACVGCHIGGDWEISGGHVSYIHVESGEIQAAVTLQV